MLYIFHVETGTMMTFDMNLALESVATLKEAVQRTCGIALDKQVLLASGGETLDPSVRVCSYSAGTDTSPIFLFSKSAIESGTPPTPSVDCGSDLDLKDEVDQSLNLPPTIATVAVRSQLAQQMCEQAKCQVKACEKLVHDQHLQQQGWAAVIANLDDITLLFKSRTETFEASFKQYLNTRQQYINILESFSSDVGTLSKIPVLPALLEKEGEESPAPSASPATLLQWISAKDNQASLEQVAEQCKKGLDQFDEKVLEALKVEIRATFDAANTSEMREIKGLEERLYGLEQLRCDAKKIVQEQTDLAQAFIHNQARASNLGDTSILPDLCTSHKRQLVVMLKNHHQLRDIRRRCIKAKQELSNNLYHRLKWVVYVESRLLEMDAKLVMYHDSMKRLRRNLDILSQVHMAPNVYLTAVAEVVRRRTFSQAFLVWANDLACQLCAVHSEEVARRESFQSQFEGHFLSSLFPGLEDSPPAFATQAPQLFDSNLPKLSVEDIERLRGELPDLALSLSVPDLTTITQFFLSRSVTNLKTDQQHPAASIEDRIVQAVSAAGLSSNLDPALLQPADNSQSLAQSATTTHPISSDRGFESETDTEEFEKVGQSPSDMHYEKQATRKEKELRDQLKAQLQNINGAVDEAFRELRGNMGQLKQWVLCERTELECLLDRLTRACRQQNTRLLEELKEKEGIATEAERRSYNLEERLKSTMEALELERIRREEAERLLDEERSRNEVALKELQERLTHERRDEVEAITTRYKLYSQTIEQSMSDFCHDKLEGSSLMDRVEHEAIVSRLKKEFALEKARALEEERTQCNTRLEQELAQAKLRADADRQVLFNDTVHRLMAEKDRQLEGMRARAETLIAECSKHKDTISRLTDSTMSIDNKDTLLLRIKETPFPNFSDYDVSRSIDNKDSLLLRIRELETEKARLSTELAILKSAASSPPLIRGPRSISPSTSVVTIDSGISSCRDAATSPDHSPRKSRMLKEKLTKSTNNLIQQGKISIGSCNVGDAVLVVWDDALSAYTIVQDSSSLYFLHPDCLESLGLHCANPRRLYSTGEVVHKEYCQAKKPENRYHVPKGSKFYRVKVQPVSMSRSQQLQQSPHSSLGSSGHSN